MRLFASHLRKLARRRATLITFGLLGGLIALVFISVGATINQPGAGTQERAIARALVTFPDAYAAIVSFTLSIGGLLAVAFGAAVAGSEWTWGTLKSAVARGESRSRYVLSAFAAVVVVLAVGIVVTWIAGFVAALVGAALAGTSTAGLGDAGALGRLPEQYGRSLIAFAEQAGLGFAIATLTRSQLAGIGAGIGLYFGEQIASIFLADVVRYLPFSAAAQVSTTQIQAGGGGGPGAGTESLDPNLALLLVVAWLGGALLVAAGFTERAEITG